METTITLSSLLFALCLSISALLIYLCITPPNPTSKPQKPKPSSTQTPKDRLSTTLPIPLDSSSLFQKLLIGILFIPHLLIALFPPQNRPSTTLCRNPDFLNPDLFSWSTASLVYFLTIFIFAPLRIRAFWTLGPNFTFALSQPTKLITSGIYAYVQHPSYTTLYAVMGAVVLFNYRLDGIAACVLPESVLRMQGLGTLVQGGIMAGLVAMLWTRVRDEEELLRGRFGAEWEAWHARTKRFVPWVV